VINTRRHFNFKLRLFDTKTGTRAVAAGSLYDLTSTTARVARSSEGEEPLLHSDLPRASTLWTPLSRCTLRRATTRARITAGTTSDRDLLFTTEGRFLKGQVKIVAKIVPCSTATTTGIATHPPTTEEGAEDVAKDVLES
jgi:hypothetical protein